MSASNRLFENDRAVRLLCKRGRYFASVEGLAVHATGASSEEALQALGARYAELEAFARDTDLPIPVMTSGRATDGKPSWRRDVRMMVLTLITFGLMMLPLSYALSTALTRTAANLKIEGGAAFWHNIEEGLLKAAREPETLSLEKKEQIIAALRILVQRTRPYLDAVSPLFAGDAPRAAGVTAPSAPGGTP